MGVTFMPDMRIAGYRPTVFKDALRGFLRTQSPGNFIDLKSFSLIAGMEPSCLRNALTED